VTISFSIRTPTYYILKMLHIFHKPLIILLSVLL